MHTDDLMSSPEYLWRHNRPRPYRTLLLPSGPPMCEGRVPDTAKVIGQDLPGTSVTASRVAGLVIFGNSMFTKRVGATMFKSDFLVRRLPD